MLVFNAIGTSDLTPPNHDSWIEYWQDYKGQFGTDTFNVCPACGALHFKSELVGAHVKKADGTDPDMYIVPLCKACNQRTGAFEVPEELLLHAPMTFRR